MSLNSPILSRRSAEIAARFEARAASYEQHADLQAAVARRLASLLPDRDSPRVLELGCGTGLLSRHLVAKYPTGSFVLTDAAPAMIAECRRNLEGLGITRIRYEVMDASEASGHGGLDLIVSSMTLHWLSDPVASLDHWRTLLAPDGVLLYATLGPDSFFEWRAILAAESLPSGIAEIAPLPGVVEDEHVTPDNDSLSYLRRMKAVGGLTPRDGYAPLPPGALRRAVRATDRRFGGRVTWHIVYGRLSAPDASRSSPSIMPE
ncbi:MAG: methyltransferase [Hyphomicrobiales bacterium]